MADLTIQSLIDNKFNNIENTPESIRQAASFILENWKGLGQSSPEGWAQTALVKLDMVDEAQAKIANAQSGTDSTIRNPEAVIAQEQARVDKYLKEAYRWITGEAQPTRKKKVISRARETIDDLNEKISNLSSNIANVTDFSNPDISEEEKARLTAKAETMSRKMDDLLSMGTSYGIDTTRAQKIVRTASGYIPASDATLQQRTLREGQTTTVRQGIDGNWDVVGADGTILETGIGSQAEALAIQQQRQGGSTPDATGAFASDTSGDGTVTEKTTEDTVTDGTTSETTGETTDSRYESPEVAAVAENENIQAAMDIINNSDLPDEYKQLWGEFIKNYESTTEDTQEILNTFNKIKANEIDPYFKSLTDQTVRQINTAYQNSIANREINVESERATAGQNIRQAKEGLEAAGRTFTGKGITELGAESAYAQDGESAIPTQQPFATEGGSQYFYEGDVNQMNRLMATSSLARHQQGLESLGQQAEASLGSAGMAQLGLPYEATGGVTGDIALAKQEKEGSTLNQLLDNYYSKQDLLTNQT